MTIHRTVLSTHRMIRNTVLIVPLFLVLLVYFLREGITIDSLKFGHLQIQGLYLKLDNKLVANVHYLALPGSKKRLDAGEIERQLNRLKLLPKFFSSVALDDVVVMEEHYRILYRDNVFYLSNDAYEIAGTVRHKGKMIEGKIPFFYAKKHHFQWKGSYRYDYQDDALTLLGRFDHQGIVGDFQVMSRDDRIHFLAHTQPFSDIKPLLDLLDADPDTREWLGDRIQAKKYQIISAEGELAQQDDGYAILPMGVALKAKLERAAVRFENKLLPVVVDSAGITLKKMSSMQPLLTQPMASEASRGARCI